MKGATDYDFIIALVLFFSVYASVFAMLPYMTMSSSETQDIISMEAVHLSETIVKSPGYPYNWNSTTVTKLGLAYYGTTYWPNILDYNKITEINNTNCDEYTTLTYTTINFKITVETDDYTAGCTNTPPANARIVERHAMVYDGSKYEPAVMRLYAWNDA